MTVSITKREYEALLYMMCYAEIGRYWGCNSEEQQMEYAENNEFFQALIDKCSAARQAEITGGQT